jgi:hypothetical protein
LYDLRGSEEGRIKKRYDSLIFISILLVLVLSPCGADSDHCVPVVSVGVVCLPDGHLFLEEEVVLRRGALLFGCVLGVALGRGHVLATLGATALLGSVLRVALGVALGRGLVLATLGATALLGSVLRVALGVALGRGLVLATLGATALLGSVLRVALGVALGRGLVLATLGATALLGSVLRVALGLLTVLVIAVDVPGVPLIRRLVDVGEGIGTILPHPILLDDVRVGKEPAHLVALLEGVDVVVEVAHLTVAQGVFGDGLTEFARRQRLVAGTTEVLVLVIGGVLESIAVALRGEAVVVHVRIFGVRGGETVVARPNGDASTAAPRGGCGHDWLRCGEVVEVWKVVCCVERLYDIIS